MSVVHGLLATAGISMLTAGAYLIGGMGPALIMCGTLFVADVIFEITRGGNARKPD